MLHQEYKYMRYKNGKTKYCIIDFENMLKIICTMTMIKVNSKWYQSRNVSRAIKLALFLLNFKNKIKQSCKINAN